MKKLPKLISQEEFELLLKEAGKVKKIKKRRIRQYQLAMILGFEAGLRLSEVVGYLDRVPKLTKENFDIPGNAITIRSGKGGKDRVVPLPKRITNKHMSLLPINVARRTLQHFTTKLGHKVLKRKITFHTLRHGFGSHMAGKGVPIHQIQMLMGHSNLETTGIYLHANPKEAIKNALEVF